MDLGLNGKRFLVGGGSKGLGNGIAQVLVEEGARVVLLSRNEDELRSAAEHSRGSNSGGTFPYPSVSFCCGGPFRAR